MRFLLKLIFSTLCLIAVLWTAGFGWFVMQIPQQPAQDTQYTEAVVVLTGGSRRLERGLTLLVEGRAPKLFVSGVQEGTPLSTLLGGKEVSDIANKVPQDRVELGYNARSTLQNAEETKTWVLKNRIRSIRLVTGNYHMPRSILLMHELMPDILIIPEPVFPPEFSGNWWQAEYSLKIALSEYHKYLATLIAHMLGIISDE